MEAFNKIAGVALFMCVVMALVASGFGIIVLVLGGLIWFLNDTYGDAG